MNRDHTFTNRLFSGWKITTLTLAGVFILLSGCVSTTPEYKSMQASVKNAKLALKKDNYESAVKAYIQAVITAEDAAPDKVSSLKKSLAQTYISWSRSIYWQAKTKKNPELFKRSIFFCEKAAGVYPQYQKNCNIYISKFKRAMSEMKFKRAISVDSLLPDKRERNYKIAMLSKQGNALKRERRYMMAKAKFEDILRIDPYNLEATRSIKKIMQQVAEIGRKRKEMDDSVKMAEVEWKNVEPLASKEEAMEAAKREIESSVKLQNRLAKIKIRQLDFKDAPLNKVFTELERKITRLLHKDFQFEFKGFKPNDPNFPPITFQGKNIPAKGAIQAICNGLKLFPLYSKTSVIIEKLPTGSTKK